MTGDIVSHLQGVVFYDARGLPQVLFTTREHSIHWTEKSFQALHFQECLGEILQLPPLQYAYLELQSEKILLVNQGEGYVACLWQGTVPELSAGIIARLQTLTPDTLRQYPQLVRL
ncbi:MAG: hypothetical protein RMK91_00870 [Pseudanabaenaceae cyanobacterium SKYGB_i_bin29]|nr:hypothetical protein [Pseudanabaenaceae cyanobacterium SKYG29]MDW8420404.1 hypothetical protein [Pseudanabaenaceae cyanobacterium SKYGB_i_bin29]